MFSTSIDKRQLKNIENLARMLETAPVKIQKANDRAGNKAKQKIEEDLRRRGPAGRFIQMNYRKYGPFGLKFSFDIKPGRGGHRGGSATRQYSALIASKIFLASEQGVTGRRSFTLPSKKQKNGSTGRYVVSHSSGEWKKGQKFVGPLRIRSIGPFYFSARSGMPRKKIQKMASDIIKEQLNKEYQKEFGKMMRGS